MSACIFKSKFHIMFHFFIDIIFKAHPEMVVMIIAPGNRFYFCEAEVIIIRSFERENHIHKILAQPDDIRKLCFPRNGDHGFGWMNRDIADGPVFIYKMPEQFKRMCRLAF